MTAAWDDYDDYRDAAEKDGEAVIMGRHGGCIVRTNEPAPPPARQIVTVPASEGGFRSTFADDVDGSVGYGACASAAEDDLRVMEAEKAAMGREKAARELNAVGQEFFEFAQAAAKKRGMTVRLAPRPVQRTAEEEESFYRKSIVEDVIAGRLPARNWL